MKVSVAIIACLFCGVLPLRAEVTLYLYPRVKATGRSLTLKQIARIEAPDSIREELGALGFSGDMLSDGILDRREIQRVISTVTDEHAFIFGSAVNCAGVDGAATENQEGSIVTQGSMVRFVIRNGIISVESMGTLVREGRVGETVSVKLHDDRVLRGTLRDSKTVVLRL